MPKRNYDVFGMTESSQDMYTLFYIHTSQELWLALSMKAAKTSMSI